MSKENPFKKLKRVAQKIERLNKTTELHIQNLKDEQAKNSESSGQAQNKHSGTGERDQVES